MKKNTKLWIALSQYDLDTAVAMLESGRYLYVPYMCHQTLEKILKAHISERTKEMPPFSHNLLLLAKLTGLKFTKAPVEFFALLNPYNIETRYPKTREVLSKLCNKKTAKNILYKTRELFLCLKQKLS